MNRVMGLVAGLLIMAGTLLITESIIKNNQDRIGITFIVISFPILTSLLGIISEKDK